MEANPPKDGANFASVKYEAKNLEDIAQHIGRVALSCEISAERSIGKAKTIWLAKAEAYRDVAAMLLQTEMKGES